MLASLCDSHRRSLAKAVSWRCSASLDTFALSLLITGSLKWAGSIAGTEMLTKIVLFYLHERLWALVPWGRGWVPGRGDQRASV